MEKMPPGLLYIGRVMSNFDRLIEDGAEDKLKNGDTYGAYTGWNFSGSVWFVSGKFKCAVKVFRAHVDTIVADSLAEIMTDVSEKYGYD